MEEVSVGTSAPVTNPNYLEELVTSLELLPNQARRDLDLLRVLDREVVHLTRQIVNIERQQLLIALRVSELRGQLASLPPLRKPADTDSAEEKEQLIATATTHHRLSVEISTLLASHEEMIRTCGELSETVAQRTEEKISLAKGLVQTVEVAGTKVETDARALEIDIHGVMNEPNIPVHKALTTGTECACKISSTEKTLILAQVVTHIPDLGSYEVMDVDDQQRYQLPESYVHVLGVAEVSRRLTRGDYVFALYPDTTIFYPATVVQPPKRSGGSTTGGTTVVEPMASVRFHDDEDTNGEVIPRLIPLRYIVRG